MESLNQIFSRKSPWSLADVQVLFIFGTVKEHRARGEDSSDELTGSSCDGAGAREKRGERDRVSEGVMATQEWLAQCLKRREAGDKVTVVSSTGASHQLGGQAVQQRFFFGLCPSCHKVGEHKPCAGCLMVSYCSRDCQKKDWRNHKTVCKILTKIRGGSKTHLFHNDPSAQPRVTQALELSLGRKLAQHEAGLTILQ